MLKKLDKIRLNKYISLSGICSRRQADKYIEQGLVEVNGKITTELGTVVDEDKDEVKFNCKIIKPVEEKKYIMLNKPLGYITTSKEQFGRSYILQLIKENIRVFPVGRLDMHSEGLILLTNDGDFANRVTHPTKHIEKEYEVELKNNVTDEQTLKLQQGVDIGGYITKEAVVKQLGKKKISIVIKEGKNRQVRKMCDAVGNSVIKLKRTRIGGLFIDDLETGEYRYLTKKDIDKVFRD